jgi:predicted DNA-binding transcriptional regulator AlpA
MAQSETAPPTYVRATYLLRRYNVSRATLWRGLKRGTYPAPLYLPGGQRRWRLADLEAWEQALPLRRHNAVG